MVLLKRLNRRQVMGLITSGVITIERRLPELTRLWETIGTPDGETLIPAIKSAFSYI